MDLKEMEQLLLDNKIESFPGQQEVWRHIEQNELMDRRTSRYTVLRASLVMAVMLVLITGTVFSQEISAAVRNFLHGNVAVSEYAELIAEDGEVLSGRTRFLGEDAEIATPEEIKGGIEKVHFETLTELAQATGFLPRQAHDTLLQLDDFYAVRYSHSGRFMRKSTMIYRASSSPAYFVVNQTYVGENASVDISHTTEFEAIPTTVNGFDAVYVEFGLYWVDGDYAFDVNGSSGYGGSMEDHIAFAESLYRQ